MTSFVLDPAAAFLALHRDLIKGVVQNDLELVRRCLLAGAETEAMYTLRDLVSEDFLGDKVASIIKNAEISLETLISNKRTHDAVVKCLQARGECKVICLPVLVNDIILTYDTALTALQIAVMVGWKPIILELVKDLKCPNRVILPQGLSILHLLCTAAVLRDKKCFMFDEDIVESLLDRGADPNLPDVRGVTFINFAVLCSDFGFHQRWNLTRYDTSSSGGDDRLILKRIEMFLVNGCLPNVKPSGDDRFPLLFEIFLHDMYRKAQPRLYNLLLNHSCTFSSGDVTQFTRFLQSRSENFNADTEKKVFDSFNRFNDHLEVKYHLINAVKTQSIQGVTALLEKTDDLNVRDEKGVSLLHLAVKLGNYDIAKLLLEKGACVNIKGWNNCTTPLFNAIVSDRCDIVELLLRNGAKTNVFSANRLSPLYFAIVNNKSRIIDLLLKHKANSDMSLEIYALSDNLFEFNEPEDMKKINAVVEKMKLLASFSISRKSQLDYRILIHKIDLCESLCKMYTKQCLQYLLTTFPPMRLLAMDFKF